MQKVVAYELLGEEIEKELQKIVGGKPEHIRKTAKIVEKNLYVLTKSKDATYTSEEIQEAIRRTLFYACVETYG